MKYSSGEIFQPRATVIVCQANCDTVQFWCHILLQWTTTMAVVIPREAVRELCGRGGDQTIRDYVAAVLELGDFDLGRSGETAYEAFGQMLVSMKILSAFSPCMSEHRIYISGQKSTLCDVLYMRQQCIQLSKLSN